VQYLVLAELTLVVLLVLHMAPFLARLEAALLWGVVLLQEGEQDHWVGEQGHPEGWCRVAQGRGGGGRRQRSAEQQPGLASSVEWE
jgi:hypothetical protein